MSDSAPRTARIAIELKCVINNAYRDPDVLCDELSELLALGRLDAAIGADAGALERVHCLHRDVLPHYLNRLGDSADAKATRDLFKWESSDGELSLTDRYDLAVEHYVEPLAPASFGRRGVPRLLKRFASRIVEFDTEEQRGSGESPIHSACRELWGLRADQSVTLVFPELPEHERPKFASASNPDHIRLHRFADLDSLFELKAFFTRQFPGISVQEFTWQDVPDSALIEDIIVVGGIAYNPFMADAMDRLDSPFRQLAAPAGEPDALVARSSNEEYRPEHSAGGSVTADFGFFAKAPNPFNRDRSMVLINGVLTHGVLGAAKCFSDLEAGPRNCESVLDTLDNRPPQFAVLVRVAVLANRVKVPELDRGDLVDTIEYPFPS